MKSWQSDKLDSNIEADLLISWLHERSGGEGVSGREHVKLNIRHERQKSKTDMQIHVHSRTHARAALPVETLPTHFFAPVTCQIFATDYASGKSEIARVSD